MRTIIVFSHYSHQRYPDYCDGLTSVWLRSVSKNEETKSRYITNLRMLRLCSLCLCIKLFHIISVEWKLTRFYCSGLLCKPQPWKHFMNLLDSLPLAVRNSLRGFSGCFTRRCWIYTWKKNEILSSFTSWLLEINLLCHKIFVAFFHESWQLNLYNSPEPICRPVWFRLPNNECLARETLVLHYRGSLYHHLPNHPAKNRMLFIVTLS